MDLATIRTFLLGAYHDLPNVLFMGSLILGSMTGYLPLVWLALGLIFNGASISILQGLFKLLFPTWSQIAIDASYNACAVIGRAISKSSGVQYVAPSHWISATVFFAVFIIYNSIQIYLREAPIGVSEDKIDNRKAFSFTTLIMGLVFFLLALTRGFTGCETWFGGISGMFIGGGLAVGYWHLLDACGSGLVPDILQVVASSAPTGADDETPIVCSVGV